MSGENAPVRNAEDVSIVVITKDGKKKKFSTTPEKKWYKFWRLLKR